MWMYSSKTGLRVFHSVDMTRSRSLRRRIPLYHSYYCVLIGSFFIYTVYCITTVSGLTHAIDSFEQGHQMTANLVLSKNI